MNATSAESNAVFPGVRGLSGGRKEIVEFSIERGCKPKQGRSSPRSPCGDVGLAAAVQVAHVVARAVELDHGVDIPSVGLPSGDRTRVFFELGAANRQIRVVVRRGVERDPAVVSRDLALQKAATYIIEPRYPLVDLKWRLDRGDLLSERC